MRHSGICSAAHPPWVGPKVVGGTRATGEMEENPTKRLRAGRTTGQVRIPVDESREETAEWVARHQADE